MAQTRAKTKKKSPAKLLEEARVESFAPAEKKALRMPVKPKTSKPQKPESMRPRSWANRTVS